MATNDEYLAQGILQAGQAIGQGMMQRGQNIQKQREQALAQKMEEGKQHWQKMKDLQYWNINLLNSGSLGPDASTYVINNILGLNRVLGEDVGEPNPEDYALYEAALKNSMDKGPDGKVVVIPEKLRYAMQFIKQVNQNKT